MDRSIIHLNIADFAVAVERVADSRLKDSPVVIAPEGASRAAVYDMSQEAFLAGVRKGMALKRAVRFCRDIRILPPHPYRYERAMRAFLKRILPYSPLIETGEIDGHIFVDVTGTTRLFGPPMDIAWRLRKQVRKDLGFDPIWALASNKLVAKVATRLVKPTGEYIVAAGEEESFLAPLPLHLVPGIEKNDLVQFAEFNLKRVCQVAELNREQLRIPFGNRACFLFEAVRGIDPSPVLPAGKGPSGVVLDYEFGEDTNDAHILEGVLYSLVEKAGSRLRKRRLAARRVAVFLDYSDGIRCIRQRAAKSATANDLDLFDLAKAALGLAWIRRVRIRHLRFACDRLIFPPIQQMQLFSPVEKERQRRIRLVDTIDKIRGRFGRDVLQVGRTMAA